MTRLIPNDLGSGISSSPGALKINAKLPSGEITGKARARRTRKLTPRDKLAAAVAAMEGRPQAELMREYGASRQSILAWRHKLKKDGAVVFAHYGDPAKLIAKLNAQIRFLQRKIDELEIELRHHEPEE